MTERKRQHRGDGTLYQRPDGLWCAQVEVGYVNGKRRRKTIYDRNYDRAVKKRDAAKRERDAGILATTNPTVEKWMRQWLDEIAADKVKPRTLATYRSYVEVHIIPTLGKVRLNKLTADHVDQLHAAMSGKSSTTRLHAHRILGTALEVARKRRLIPHNAVTENEHAPRKAVPDRDALTADEAKAVLGAVGDDRNASRWWAAFLTGARQGELLGLRWSHVDLELGYIDLAWTLQRVPYRHGCDPACGKKRAASCPDRRLFVPDGIEWHHLTGNLCLLPPKTEGSRRLVPLLPAMVAALTLHRERTKDEPNPHGLVWHHPDGRPLDGRRDWQQWRDLLDEAGVAKSTLHEARNTAATLLLEAGVDPRVIAAILGHSRLVTTRDYQTVSLEMARSAVASLGQTLGISAA